MTEQKGSCGCGCIPMNRVEPKNSCGCGCVPPEQKEGKAEATDKVGTEKQQKGEEN